MRLRADRQGPFSFRRPHLENALMTTPAPTPAAKDTPAAAVVVAPVVAPVVPTPEGVVAPVVPAVVPAAAAVDPNAAAVVVPPVVPAVAPTVYALTVPEGGPLDAADLDSIAVQARAKGWTNDEAQAAATEYSDALKAQSTRFLTDTQAHTEVGGERLAASQEAARTVLDKFLPADSPEGQALRSGFNKTGYGNWAPLVLLLSRIGKAMAEDKPLSADVSHAAKPRDAASVLYGDSA